MQINSSFHDSNSSYPTFQPAHTSPTPSLHPLSTPPISHHTSPRFPPHPTFLHTAAQTLITTRRHRKCWLILTQRSKPIPPHFAGHTSATPLLHPFSTLPHFSAQTSPTHHTTRKHLPTTSLPDVKSEMQMISHPPQSILPFFTPPHFSAYTSPTLLPHLKTPLTVS